MYQQLNPATGQDFMWYEGMKHSKISSQAIEPEVERRQLFIAKIFLVSWVVYFC